MLLCDPNYLYQIMESSKIGIEKFDGSNFGFWKMQIEDYLY